MEESSLESDLELTTALNSATVSNDVINVKGDDVALTVQAKEPNGAVASGVGGARHRQHRWGVDCGWQPKNDR